MTTTAFAISLVRLRRRSERNMPERAVISRPALSDDGAGGRTETYATIASNVPCRIESVNLRDVQNLASMVQTGSQTLRITEDKTWALCFPIGTPVQRKDNVVIAGVTYRIMDMQDRLTNEAHLTTLALEL